MGVTVVWCECRGKWLGLSCCMGCADDGWTIGDGCSWVEICGGCMIGIVNPDVLAYERVYGGVVIG